MEPVSYLPAEISVVHVTHKQRLGGESVGLDVDICSGHLTRKTQTQHVNGGGRPVAIQHKNSVQSQIQGFSSTFKVSETFADSHSLYPPALTVKNRFFISTAINIVFFKEH